MGCSIQREVIWEERQRQRDVSREERRRQREVSREERGDRQTRPYINVQRSLLSSNTTTDIKIKPVNEPFESSECPVCMEEFDKTDIMVTTCGHKFHTTCMFKHLRNANKCPCCREVLF